MARPIKQGLDYFPLDVNLQHDDKLQMIIGEFGFKGEFLYVKLLSFIYKNDGYFCEWNEETQLKFATSVAYSLGGSQVNLINEIVIRCVKWGLFNKSVFDMFTILTSKRIQETWKEASRKRKCALIDDKINLLLVNGGLKAEETQKKAEESTQRKEKESKVNKLIINGNFPEEYSEAEFEFISIWKKARLFYDKKQCGFEKLLPFEKQCFKQLLNDFTKKEFEYAVAGLFFQETVPAVRVRPDWVLKRENFEKMLDCWVNKNKLFEKPKTETTNDKFQKGDC